MTLLFNGKATQFYNADELPALVPGLEVLHHCEAWRANNRHEAHLVARRPA